MRDCRTKGETPLHRAAAFGDEEAIQMLLDAGAKIDATDAPGDSPLSWASWYLRPIPILRKLLYGGFHIHTDYGKGMAANLLTWQAAFVKVGRAPEPMNETEMPAELHLA
jgi:hypothetical protein